MRADELARYAAAMGKVFAHVGSHVVAERPPDVPADDQLTMATVAVHTGFDSGLRVALERPALARELVEATTILLGVNEDPMLEELEDVLGKSGQPWSVAQLETAIVELGGIVSIADGRERRRRADEILRSVGFRGTSARSIGIEAVEELRKRGAI